MLDVADNDDSSDVHVSYPLKIDTTNENWNHSWIYAYNQLALDDSKNNNVRKKLSTILIKLNFFTKSLRLRVSGCWEFHVSLQYLSSGCYRNKKSIIRRLTWCVSGRVKSLCCEYGRNGDCNPCCPNGDPSGISENETGLLIWTERPFIIWELNIELIGDWHWVQ